MDNFLLILGYNESLLLNEFFLLNGNDLYNYKFFSFLLQKLSTTKPTNFDFFEVFLKLFGHVCLGSIFSTYLWKNYQQNHVKKFWKLRNNF